MDDLYSLVAAASIGSLPFADEDCLAELAKSGKPLTWESSIIYRYLNGPFLERLQSDPRLDGNELKGDADSMVSLPSVYQTHRVADMFTEDGIYWLVDVDKRSGRPTCLRVKDGKAEVFDVRRESATVPHEIRPMIVLKSRYFNRYGHDGLHIVKNPSTEVSFPGRLTPEGMYEEFRTSKERKTKQERKDKETLDSQRRFVAVQDPFDALPTPKIVEMADYPPRRPGAQYSPWTERCHPLEVEILRQLIARGLDLIVPYMRPKEDWEGAEAMREKLLAMNDSELITYVCKIDYLENFDRHVLSPRIRYKPELSIRTGSIMLDHVKEIADGYRQMLSGPLMGCGYDFPRKMGYIDEGGTLRRPPSDRAFDSNNIDQKKSSSWRTAASMSFHTV